MLRSIGLGLLLTSLAGPAIAQCATEGLRVRCIYVGPNEQGQDAIEAPEKAEIAARFVTAPPRNSERAIANRFRSVAARKNKAIKPTYAKGDILPVDVLIMMNPGRHGLPRPRDGWAYFAINKEIYRAELRSRRVLDFVNPHISRY